MKRNKFNTPRTRGKSPYNTKRKKPFRYHEIITKWQKAAKERNFPLAETYADQWRRYLRMNKESENDDGYERVHDGSIAV